MMSVLDAPPVAELVALAQRKLPADTFRHVFSTAEFMVTFSDALDLDLVSVATAGILHDLCKPLSNARLLAKAQKYGIDITPSLKAAPFLLHGPVAAEWARCELDITDDVYEAIYWHTTGKPGLCNLGLALYFADYAEPLRLRPEAAKARQILTSEGFQAALLYVTPLRLAHVKTKAVVEPTTEAFAAWIQTINNTQPNNPTIRQ